jgi:hypothetical protein
MATMKSYKAAKEEEYLQPPTIVDVDIIEYFYAADIYDVLADDSLIKLIDSNGFYKTAFCEAYDMDEITVTIGTKNMTWHGAPLGVPTAYETFVKGKIGLPGTLRKNLTVDNINDVSIEVE